MSATSLIAANQILLNLLAAAQTVGTVIQAAQSEGRPISREEWAAIDRADAEARAATQAKIDQARAEGR